jgi:uncharacterized protein (TIGR03000 family)
MMLMIALGNAPDPQLGVVEKANPVYATHNHTLNRGRGCGCSCGGRGGRCHGCYGCYCSGCWCSGCWGGCWGGCYGGYGGWGCHGCYGGYGSYGYGGYGYGSFVQTDAPATLIVNLPPDAKLTIEDQPTRSQSAQRTFVSPPLKQGESYKYTLKAEINRDGKPMTMTKEVPVQAGRRAEVNFDFRESTARR